MRIAFNRLFNFKALHNLRSICTSQNVRSDFDGPTKTTVNVLNNTEVSLLMIDAYDQMGFSLNMGIKMIGPMILFPRSLLFWNVRSARDINKDSLTLFDILEPKIDLLIIGLEDDYDYKFIYHLKKLIKELDINSEVCRVDQACAMYNFVCTEGRYAAAALIPPRKAKPLNSFQHLLSSTDTEEDSTKLIDNKK